MVNMHDDDSERAVEAADAELNDPGYHWLRRRHGLSKAVCVVRTYADTARAVAERPDADALIATRCNPRMNLG
jgi:hypothetical protein